MAIEHVLEVPPVRLTTIPGFDAAVFPYTTDIPFLAGWGEPLLFGPGSIHAAHTADESVAIAELTEAADHYVTIARTLSSTPRAEYERRLTAWREPPGRARSRAT